MGIPVMIALRDFMKSSNFTFWSLIYDLKPPSLNYDGNYTPSNRRDWWVTLVAVVYSHVVSLRAARTRKGNLSNKEFMNPSERARPMTHGEMCHMGIVTHVRQKRGTE